MIRFEVRVFARLFPLSDVCESYNHNHDQGLLNTVDMEPSRDIHTRLTSQ